ncbi:hypothetical protein CEXT_474421, partial [Caerostris extrusa]
GRENSVDKNDRLCKCIQVFMARNPKITSDPLENNFPPISDKITNRHDGGTLKGASAYYHQQSPHTEHDKR